MDSDSYEMPRYVVKLQSDGMNYGWWAQGLKTYLRCCGLWGHITGESACPPVPVPPPQLPAAANEVADAADKAMKDYQHALRANELWQSHDARTMLVLLDTVEGRIIPSLPDESAQKMWKYLQKRYQPIVDVVHRSSLQQLRTLQQNDESVDAFYDRFMDLWQTLESLVPIPDVCRACTCCSRHQQLNEKRCLYEFLDRLRPEFAPATARLLCSNPQSTVDDALNHFRVEEIQLQLQSIMRRRMKKKNRRGGRSKWESSESSGGSSSSQS